jgi:hypothetical protein
MNESPFGCSFSLTQTGARTAGQQTNNSADFGEDRAVVVFQIQPATGTMPVKRFLRILSGKQIGSFSRAGV